MNILFPKVECVLLFMLLSPVTIVQEAAFPPLRHLPRISLQVQSLSSISVVTSPSTSFYGLESFAFMMLKSPPHLITHLIFPLYFSPQLIFSTFLLECPFTPLDLKWTFTGAHIPSQLCFPGSCKDASHTEP